MAITKSPMNVMAVTKSRFGWLLGALPLFLRGAMSSSTKRAALYVRVGTDAQTVENQIRELRQVAKRGGAGMWWKSTKMRASQAPRDETDGLASIPCSRTPAGGNSISSWHGRLTAWA